MQTQLEKAEKLLNDIKNTGSHWQIKEKIDEYFKEKDRDMVLRASPLSVGFAQKDDK